MQAFFVSVTDTGVDGQRGPDRYRFWAPLTLMPQHQTFFGAEADTFIAALSF